MWEDRVAQMLTINAMILIKPISNALEKYRHDFQDFHRKY